MCLNCWNKRNVFGEPSLVLIILSFLALKKKKKNPFRHALKDYIIEETHVPRRLLGTTQKEMQLGHQGPSYPFKKSLIQWLIDSTKSNVNMLHLRIFSSVITQYPCKLLFWICSEQRNYKWQHVVQLETVDYNRPC